MGVSKNSGTPKWMVYKFIMENPMNKWMIWGETFPLFLEIPIYFYMISIFRSFTHTFGNGEFFRVKPKPRWSGRSQRSNFRLPGGETNDGCVGGEDVEVKMMGLVLCVFLLEKIGGCWRLTVFFCWWWWCCCCLWCCCCCCWWWWWWWITIKKNTFLSFQRSQANQRQ